MPPIGKFLVQPFTSFVEYIFVWMRFYGEWWAWTRWFKILFSPFLILGFFYLFFRQKDNIFFRKILFFIVFYYFFISSGAIRKFGIHIPFLETFMAFRYKLSIGFYIPFAIIFSLGIKFCTDPKLTEGKLASVFKLVVVKRAVYILVGSIILLSIGEVIFTHHGTIMTELDLGKDRSKWLSMVDFLNDPNSDLDHDNYRIAVQNASFLGGQYSKRFGFANSHLAALGGMNSGAQLIGAAWQGPYGNDTNIFGWDKLTPSKIREKSRRLNIHYFMVSNEEVISVLETMDDIHFHGFFGNYKFYELTSHVPGWAYGKSAHSIIPNIRWKPNQIMEFEIPPDLQDTGIIISRSYSSKIEAYLNGNPIKINSWQSLCEIILPPGDHSEERLVLKFNNRKTVPIVSFFSGILLLLFVLYSKLGGFFINNNVHISLIDKIDH